ncbi:MAG TPA: DUF5939 domain-containing protein [Polyangiaceae bacterium]|jgi:class 3 adenylate cyclase
MRPIAITGAVELAATPEDVWRYVSDTDRTNRALGAAPVEYTSIEDGAASGARFVARTRAGGFALTYEELPFEWSHAKELRVVRRMRGGVLESYVVQWSLAPGAARPGGTRVTVKLELTPRLGLLRPVAWLQARAIVARLLNFTRSIDRHVIEQGPSPFATDAAASPMEVNEPLLAQGVAALTQSAVSGDLARRLARHLREASDVDLVRIRPFELADAWKEDRDAVLRAMLHGVPAGLFDLRWAIICPSCLTASELAAALDEVKPEGHCQMCDISFELEIDRAVEATFVPHEAVRKVEERMFCIAGPARTPHVWAQTNVRPEETRALDAPRELGRYRLFSRGGAVGSLEVKEGAAGEVQVAIVDGGFRPADAQVAPAGRLQVSNATPQARHVKVERLGYASDAATAHYVSTVDEFRRLFSRELVKPGTPLKVTRVAILFSDLTGSTALYTRVGDAAAFRLVDDHFDVLRETIVGHGGGIVKTMGDAVMAAFREPASCVRAAAAALGAFERFRAGREHADHIGLKLGAVVGPCYVVTANGALDYFGQTVNVASRVQHLAGSGELVVPRELAEVLPSGGGDELRVVERFEARVKGVETPLDLVRLRLVEENGRAGG